MHEELDDLKMHISKALELASPKPGETLLLYLMATTQVICPAPIVELEDPRHVYKV
jgi:hypothetical protein